MSDFLPPLHAAASNASGAGQRLYLAITGVQLVLAVCGACSGLVALVTSPTLGAIVVVVAFGATALLRLQVQGQHPERQWYDGRAVAESVKTLSWRYAMGADPFGLNDAHADSTFTARLQEVLALARTMTLGDVTPGSQITTEMRRVRGESLRSRKKVYDEQRIGDQQRWYSGKAASSRLSGIRWRRTSLVLELAGLVVGIMIIAGIPLPLSAVGVIGAATAATVAWLQAKQHDSLAHAYAIAAVELGNIHSQIGAIADEGRWGEFVVDAEEAISREHTLWRASRGVGVAIPSRS